MILSFDCLLRGLCACVLDTASLWSKPRLARWRWQDAARQGPRARWRGSSGGHSDSPVTRYETKSPSFLFELIAPTVDYKILAV